MNALAPETFHADLRTQFDAFIDDHRDMMAHVLDDLTQEEARRRMVPSLTTLLGLVKHATMVERVWLTEAALARPRAELGIPETVDDSFTLADDDTIESVRAAYLAACDESRTRLGEIGLDDVLTGNRRGPLPLRWIYLHVLREVAQHCGHADILREQILASRT